MRQPKSSKPRKQRKFLHDAFLHLKRKILSAHFSNELGEKYKRISMPVIKGDQVQIMRGKFKGKTGKVAKVNYKKYRVYIEGVTRKRTVGTEAQVGIHPSKLKLVDLNLNDKNRQKILERKGVKIEIGPKVEKQS
ncbi:MAG: 50S ribosomal protein L24 [Candidatus Aenigmarchaeota archaeon]|nr:50S ribosomal protein L24 [Candidatus Aenigmarchaeota archaeon]